MEQNKFHKLVLEALQLLLVGQPGDVNQASRDKLIEELELENRL